MLRSALLESAVCLADIMRRTGFLPQAWALPHPFWEDF